MVCLLAHDLSRAIIAFDRSLCRVCTIAHPKGIWRGVSHYLGGLLPTRKEYGEAYRITWAAYCPPERNMARRIALPGRPILQVSCVQYNIRGICAGFSWRRVVKPSASACCFVRRRSIGSTTRNGSLIAGTPAERRQQGKLQSREP